MNPVWHNTLLMLAGVFIGGGTGELLHLVWPPPAPRSPTLAGGLVGLAIGIGCAALAVAVVH